MGSYFKGDEKYRGIALVIGNEKFDIPYGEENIDRDGCEKDIRMMKSMFEKLDFFVECFKDLTAQQIREKIKKASQDERNKKCQCFVLGISTHGKETLDNHVWQHEIMGSDRHFVMIEEILDMFDGKNATGLEDKPKIFFIQACRMKEKSFECDVDKGMKADIMQSKSSNFYEKEISEFDEKKFNDNCDNIYAGWVRDKQSLNYDPHMPKVPGSQPEPISYSGNQLPEPGLSGDASGSNYLSKQIPELEPAGDASGSTDASNKLPEQETSSDAKMTTDSDNKPQDPFDVLSVKCPKDCLIYYPVESGKVALRSIYNGSVMYQAMYQQFPKLLKGYSIIKYLTYVNMELSKRNLFYENEYVKITGSYITRMNKHVVFKPLTMNSPMAKAQEMVKSGCTVI